MLFGMRRGEPERHYVLCSCGTYIRRGPGGDRPVLPAEREPKVVQHCPRCSKCTGTAYDVVDGRRSGELHSETRERLGYFPGTRAALKVASEPA